MKSPKEIIQSIQHSVINIEKVESFLEANWVGNPVEYSGELTEHDIIYMNKHGWKVTPEDNGADKYGLRSWFKIESL